MRVLCPIRGLMVPMVWLWRGLAAVGVLAVLLGVGVAVATGPVTAGSPLATAPTSDTAIEAPAPSGPEPLPTGDGTGDLTEVLAEPPAYIPYEERPRAVFLGDSITRGYTEPSSGAVGPNSWFYGLLDDTTGVVRYGGTVAEVGMTIEWMASQAWNALALSPDILIVHGGTNNIDGEVDIPILISSFQRIKDAADVLGIPVAVCTLPPRDDPAADARVVALNDALRLWADEQGVILLDTGTPLRAPGGGWIYGYSGDGTHPTAEGALVMSEAAAITLRRIPLGV